MEPFALKKTGDADYPKHIKGLITGQPKSGKTTILSTLPNVVIADVEHEQAGLQSIAHLDVPYVAIDDRSKIDTLLTLLGDDQLRAKAAKDLGIPKIESVGLDTLDALQDLLKKERLKSERRQFMQRDDWGWLLEEMMSIVRAFVSLPLNVMFTVHTKQIQDDEGRIIWVPGLQGAIQDKIAGEVGFSLFTQREVEIDAKTGQKHNVYSILTEGDDSHPHLGNRAAGRLPRTIEPTFKALHDAVYSGVELAQQKRVEVQTAVQEEAKAEVADAAAEGTSIDDTDTEPPAQPSVQAAEEAQKEQTEQKGAPKDDANQPINESAISHLSKMTGEFGVDLNPAVRKWKLGQAREVARWVVACKNDAAEGKIDQGELRNEVIQGLAGMGAVSATESGDAVPNGNVDEVVEWASKSPEHAQVALRHEEAKGDDGRSTLKTKLKALVNNPPEKSGQASEQEPEPEPEAKTETAPEPEAQDADEEVQPEPETAPEAEPEAAPEQEETPEPPSPEEAEALIKSELGGEEIAPEDLPDEQRACEECGKSKASHPDEFDIDIARLSEIRLKKWLCVEDYMTKVQAKKAAS